MFKVIVMGNVRREGVDIVKEFAEPVLLEEPVREDRLMEEIKDADAILHKIGKLKKDILQHQTKLQIIARHGVGLDDLDLNYIQTLGIPVTITPGKNTNAVAEFTIGLMFALLRNICKADVQVKKHRSWARESFMGFEIQRLHVGIVGMGRIGNRIADLLTCMGAGILAYDPLVESTRRDVTVLPFEALLAKSDVITFHCPLTDATRHMINMDNIRLIKDGAYLINTARGGVVDPEALTAALKTGKLKGAALDVYSSEPPDFQSELFRMDNVITSPHIAAMSYGSQIGMAQGAADEIRRVLKLKQRPLHHIFADDSS